MAASEKKSALKKQRETKTPKQRAEEALATAQRTEARLKGFR